MSVPRQIKKQRQLRLVGDCVIAVLAAVAVVVVIDLIACEFRNVGELPAGARCVRADQEVLQSGPQVDGEVFHGFSSRKTYTGKELNTENQNIL